MNRKGRSKACRLLENLTNLDRLGAAMIQVSPELRRMASMTFSSL